MGLPSLRHGAWGLALVFALLACGDDEEELFGDAETSSGGSGAGAGGAATTSSAGGGACVDLGEGCTQCELAACPDLYCDWYANPQGGLLTNCLFACTAGDLDCYQSCYSDHPDGISDTLLLGHCAAQNCTATNECGPFQPQNLDGCQLCLFEQCPGQMNTCVANPSCTPLLQCLAPCGSNTNCQDACYAMYPEGQNAAVAVGSCLLSNCPQPCGL